MDRRAAQRFAGDEETIFATMSALAVRTGSLNLGQGFPDSEGPESVREAAVAALRGGRNQYAPGRGVPELRQAVARHQRRYGLDLDPDTQVVVTAGATEGIAGAILGLVDPGDEVVVLEPSYDSYLACLRIARARVRLVTLRWPYFRVDLDDLRAAVTDRTRLLLINSPHNPTGMVLTAEERRVIAEVAQRHDVLVLTDEVYEHLTFDGRAHVPLASEEGMFDRTVTLSSAGKTFSFTGWKVGWATGPADLVDAVLAAKQWLTYTNASALQPAVAHGLDHELAWVDSLAQSLRRRRDYLVAGLKDLGLPTHRPDGGYFAVSDVGDLGWEDGLAFCRALPDRAGVVAIPAQVFYRPGSVEGRHLVRWAFCKDDAVLTQALDRLSRADLRA